MAKPEDVAVTAIHTFDVRPGDVVTFLPDGRVFGPVRIARETGPHGELVARATMQTARIERPGTK